MLKIIFYLHFLFICLFYFCTIISNATDWITLDQSIRDGQTIVSSGGSFELGFFSPGNSQYRYVGIWYKKSPTTVAWVANRVSPVTNSSSILRVIKPGNLALFNGGNGNNTSMMKMIWSTNVSSSSRTVRNPIAQLLDSGNLVLRDANDDSPENFLWQSFDYPTDTLFPDMKLGKNFITGREVFLTSWKSKDDPAPGEYTYRCDPTGYPQNIVKKGSVMNTRAGPWNGLRFSGAPNTQKNPIYSFGLFYDEKREVYFSYHLLGSTISRFVMNESGRVQRWMFVDRTRDWVLYMNAPTDLCDSYALCGPYGNCRNGNSPVCGCLDGFGPKYPNDWAMSDWSSGCIRRTPLNCQQEQNGDGFLKYSGVKLPDARSTKYNRTMTLEECKLVCLRNCSCMAYSSLDIRNGGSGCLLWLDDLVDIRELPEGQDIYIRLASSEIASLNDPNRKMRKVLILSLLLSIALMVLLGLILSFYVQKRKKRYLKLKEKGNCKKMSKKHYDDDELPQFELAAITEATNEFSLDNKVGEGGFGPVYKGVLGDGREIAVKRLSKSSAQGLHEFKNEVICIAKVQHRNLVKLLGCCIQGEEKMLIYEFMHNKSLDSFIFDPTKSRLFDWPKRFHIINGIARGLMYLHQDSRLRIIHRDLKASNILLDIDMEPKISDFGMAKSFRGNETGAKTSRVIGTYGYMSPEYAVHGIFSVKSDVFSFGVTVLEIVSGKRNRGFSHPDHHHNLLGHAWMLYKEGRTRELVDKNMGDSFDLDEVVRSIRVGLLCVQQCAQSRPNMCGVVLMLGGDGELPEAKQPGFYVARNGFADEKSSASTISSSRNDITITMLDPR